MNGIDRRRYLDNCSIFSRHPHSGRRRHRETGGSNAVFVPDESEDRVGDLADRTGMRWAAGMREAREGQLGEIKTFVSIYFVGTVGE